MRQLLNLAIGLSIFVFMVFSTLGNPNFEWFIPIEKDLSTVTLLEIGKATPEYLEKHMPGAEDGLIFVFLIISKEGEKGRGTLSERRDYKVDGISYGKTTKNKLSISIEPPTIMEDITDFIEKYRPDLKEKITIPVQSKSMVMITAIGGAKLPQDGKMQCRHRCWLG